MDEKSRHNKSLSTCVVYDKIWALLDTSFVVYYLKKKS